MSTSVPPPSEDNRDERWKHSVAVSDAVDEVMRQPDLWRIALKRASYRGAAAVNAITPEQEEGFEQYHDAFTFSLNGTGEPADPSFVVTAGHDRMGPRLVPNLHMCEQCFKVEHKLLTCSKCHKAYYCGGACQKAAWTKHKPECTKSRMRGFSRGSFLGAVLQVESIVDQFPLLVAAGVTSLPVRVGIPAADEVDSDATAFVVNSTACEILTGLPSFERAGRSSECAAAVRALYERALSPAVHEARDSGDRQHESLLSLADEPSISLVA